MTLEKQWSLQFGLNSKKQLPISHNLWPNLPIVMTTRDSINSILTHVKIQLILRRGVIFIFHSLNINFWTRMKFLASKSLYFKFPESSNFIIICNLPKDDESIYGKSIEMSSSDLNQNRPNIARYSKFGQKMYFGILSIFKNARALRYTNQI